ncbi:hypothetical protein HNR65_003414 [Desulfosalsimonas propionicica]|uniref:Helix-turn-helix protein n=1 Tax=Desulfosalsimonas propionicica TaxID=332175 RepID=A0A7W0CC63_9BACT|nr:helix-turn-helix domain-containing protein [Desulfosalsimonas propionicica]MBA2883057.1 hypothetical protein [Desulfosalsimonas propionicica]
MKNLSTEQAAEYLKSIGVRVSRKTLEAWRCYGRGPAYHKVGNRVFYRTPDLDKLADGQRVETIDSRG